MGLTSLDPFPSFACSPWSFFTQMTNLPHPKLAPTIPLLFLARARTTATMLMLQAAVRYDVILKYVLILTIWFGPVFCHSCCIHPCKPLFRSSTSVSRSKTTTGWWQARRSTASSAATERSSTNRLLSATTRTMPSPARSLRVSLAPFPLERSSRITEQLWLGEGWHRLRRVIQL